MCFSDANLFPYLSEWGRRYFLMLATCQEGNRGIEMICVGFSHSHLFCQTHAIARFHALFFFFQASYFLRRQLVWKSDLRQPFLFHFSKSSFQWEVTERSGKAASLMFDSRTFIGCPTHYPLQLRRRGENHSIIHFLFASCFVRRRKRGH